MLTSVFGGHKKEPLGIWGRTGSHHFVDCGYPSLKQPAVSVTVEYPKQGRQALAMLRRSRACPYLFMVSAPVLWPTPLIWAENSGRAESRPRPRVCFVLAVSTLSGGTLPARLLP